MPLQLLHVSLLPWYSQWRFLCCRSLVFVALLIPSKTIISNPTLLIKATALWMVQHWAHVILCTSSLMKKSYPLLMKVQWLLFFCQESHIINQTLRVSNLSEVDICPWDEQQEVLIECHQDAQLAFQDIIKVKIFSLHFTFCTLQYFNQKIDNNRSIYVEKSIFEDSKKNYAVYVKDIRSGLNITVRNCRFLSNNGSMAVNSYLN